MARHTGLDRVLIPMRRRQRRVARAVWTAFAFGVIAGVLMALAASPHGLGHGVGR